MTMEKSEFIRLLNEGFSQNGLPLCDETAAARFFLLTEEMLRVNEVMNLTAITKPEEIIIKHYADCAKGARFIGKNVRLMDVGTGGGFPALPFAILRGDISVLAVDSTRKKLDYVENTAKLLGLDNLSVCVSRAEALGQNPEYREQFDMVTARAVARLNVLAEWCLPLLKKGGVFLAMKAKSGMDELEEAKHAIETLGGVEEETEQFLLKNPFAAENEDAMTRTLILIRKRQFTPKQYPRNNAQISKKPL